MSTRIAVSVEYPGKAPGPAAITIAGGRIEFTNQILSGSWGFSPEGLQGTTVRDQQSGVSWETARELFRIVLADDTAYSSSSLKVVNKVSTEPLASQPSGPRLADRFAGSGCEVTMVSADERLHVVWRAVMLDEANYIRQELELSAPQGDADDPGSRLARRDHRRRRQRGERGRLLGGRRAVLPGL